MEDEGRRGRTCFERENLTVEGWNVLLIVGRLLIVNPFNAQPIKSISYNIRRLAKSFVNRDVIINIFGC